MPATSVYKWLVEEGNESNVEAVGDYSSGGQGATSFVYEVPVGFELHLARLIVTIEDGAGMRAERYGGLSSALTNGIIVESLTSEDVVDMDLTDGHPVKTNADWASFCYDAQVLSWGAGDELLVARWSFDRAGQPFVVPAGEHFTVRLQDDMSGLIAHRFVIQGLLVDLGETG